MKEVVPPADCNRSHIILLSSECTGYRNDTDRELIFRQESNFFWLTGCDLPGSHLIVAYPGGHTPDSFVSHLYIPKEDPLETLWSPPPPTLDEARKLFDAKVIGFSKDLKPGLEGILEKHRDHVLHILPTSTLFPDHPQAISEHLKTANDKYLLTALHRARLIKKDFEISLIKKANEISSRAHEVVMRLLGQGVKDGSSCVAKKSGVIMPSEWRIVREAEAEAVFVASCRREGFVYVPSPMTIG